ncbi:MAG: DedA family protein [Culicoidibacterales bacterium]
MQDIIMEILNQFGYLGIASLIALENIFPPIPSEIILTFGGFLTTYTDLTFVGVLIAATVGAVIGAVILYSVGRLLTPERLEALLDYKVFRMLGFKHGDINKTVIWFEKHGKSAVFFGRFVPVIRSLISIPAGIAKINFVMFLIFTTVGSLIWNFVLIALGVFMGSAWEQVSTYVGIYSQVILISLIVMAVIGGAIFYYQRHQKQNREN